MPKLMPIVQDLDKCILDAEHRCTRCDQKYDRQFSDKFFVMCKKGTSRTIGYSFWCPGCKSTHPYYTIDFRTAMTGHSNPVWSFNGDMESPTFSPSLQVGSPGAKDCCHLHVVGGVIQYANDGGTAHALKGQNVPLGEFKWHED